MPDTQPTPEEKYAEVLELGNLTEMAEDTTPALAIGIMSIIWTCWIIMSMLIPWQNSYFNLPAYNPPITYIWTYTCAEHPFYSFLTGAYFYSWIFNTLIFFIELIAWMVNGDFFIIWMYVGLWGGAFLGALPWVFIIAYIFHEWPDTQSGSAWAFIFWSAEFWMLFMQGLLWLASLIIHIIFIGPAIRMVMARQALDAGLEDACQCEPCEIPDKEEGRAEAEKACKTACDAKCPKEGKAGEKACPLKRFEDESAADYKRRCVAAAQLAQAAAEREAEDDFDQETGDEDGLPSVDLEAETGDDIAGPDDEW